MHLVLRLGLAEGLDFFLQEVTIRGGGLKHVECPEDEDFIQALDKMMLENLQV